MKYKTNQSGAAPILFTMFMVIIVSLIAVGFATLVRNDQRATLDKTLSNQAQYAAESSINKVRAAILAGTITTNSKSDCSGQPTSSVTSQKPTFATSGIQVSCLTWDLSPDALVKNPLTTDGPWSTMVEPTSAANIGSLVFEWSPINAANNGQYASSTSLPDITSGKAPVLKVVLANNTLASSTTMFLVPVTAGGGGATAAQQGGIANASCSGSPLVCKAILNTLPGGNWSNGAGRGWMAVSTYGDQSSVRVTGFSNNNGGGSQAKFVGAQATIDATARAQDVIKRLTASVPLDSLTWRPGFSASADTLCKNFKVDSNTNAQPGPASGTVCP
jgi:Tfp pilus assembly protein PilX